MIQRHSMILWKKAERENKSFEEISKEAQEVLSLFKDCPQELKLNYLNAKKKKDNMKYD